MIPLLKVVLTLGAFFTSMLLVAKATGVLDLEQIRAGLEQLRAEGAPWWSGAVVTALLFADLFLAVPTMEVSILSGHVLGFAPGFLWSLAGVSAAGLAGYGLGRWRGEPVLRRILRDEREREDLRATFLRHGIAMILLARAVPVMPEVSACLAGVTGMPLRRFALAWLAVSVPYLALATWSGSISRIEHPYPALAAAVGLTVVTWTAWAAFRRRLRAAEARART